MQFDQQLNAATVVIPIHRSGPLPRLSWHILFPFSWPVLLYKSLKVDKVHRGNVVRV